MKKIYFNVRPTSRERMWDTVRHASEVCAIFIPNNVIQQSSIKTHYNSSSLLSRVKYEISKEL